jgi:hypothetical protein
MHPDLEKVAQEMQDFFAPLEVETIARQTGFVKRQPGLTGLIFLQAMIFASIEHQQVSLKQLAQSCHDLGLKITAQGFDQRLGPESVAFMQAMFSQAMTRFRNELPLPLAILHQFSHIYLLDSTIIPLPDSLVDQYPGSGGNASAASLKIQLLFDFLYGNLEQIEFRAGREPDQGYDDYLSMIQPGALILLDLGYFKLDNLKKLAAKGYFLSRYLPRTGLLTPQGAELDLLSLLQANPDQIIDQQVLLGKQAKHQLPVRLIAIPLAPEAADRRRYQAKQAAKRQGKTLSKERLALLGWLILVTNVPQSMLSVKQVALLYRVRWQIELVFKLWKSFCGLRHLASWRPDRILTELYARLIGVILTHFLLAPIRMPYGPWANREISPVQVRKIFKRFARSLHKHLFNSKRLVAELAEMFDHISLFGFKQKRLKKPNIGHALALTFSVFKLDLNSHQALEVVAIFSSVTHHLHDSV